MNARLYGLVLNDGNQPLKMLMVWSVVKTDTKLGLFDEAVKFPRWAEAEFAISGRVIIQHSGLHWALWNMGINAFSKPC